MYVIFPADEVVYLSYGRLIVVPANSNPEKSNNPIRTNALPLENTSSNSPIASLGSTKSKQSNCSQRSNCSEPIPGPSRIVDNLVENQPSTSRGDNQINQDIKISQDVKLPQESKPKKRSLKFNFNLIKRSNSKISEQSSGTPRVRYSIGHKDQARATTPPSEAFKKYCYISPAEPSKSPITPPSLELKTSLPEQAKGFSFFSSKRSSSSSKNSKQHSFNKEEQGSKHSSSSSKSTKQDKSLPLAFSNNTSDIKRSHSQIQRETRKEPTRKTSATTTLSADVFYPLSTSREKNLVEPSPEPKLKARSSSFRLSLRRSKTPEVSASQPLRPERKKEKKAVKPRSGLERKLSFSDFLTVGRERSSELLPEVIVTSDRENSPIQRDKSPVLGFFRRTPSPKYLGRDRTPNLNRDSGFYPNQNSLYGQQIEDNPRPTSTGQKHSSGEGSIMRVAIFNTNSTNIIISLALLTVFRLLYVCRKL